MEALFYKDPDAYLDYAMDWSTWLNTGENVSTYVVSVNDTVLTIATFTKSSNIVTAWLSGGASGQTYTVSIKITTDAARIEERSFRIKIKQR